VREVIAKSRAVTNRDVPIIEGERRPGDAASLVCGSTKAVQELGWQPRRSDLETMIADAWRWHQSPRFGA
jgi:UDP-galactose 4-epimerase (EC 5.1.3.2)